MGLGRGGVGGGGEDIPKIEWVKSEKLVGNDGPKTSIAVKLIVYS
jgi:hypothetical protein